MKITSIRRVPGLWILVNERGIGYRVSGIGTAYRGLFNLSSEF